MSNGISSENTTSNDLVDSRIFDANMPEKDKGAGTLRLKKRAAQQTQPGHWRNNEAPGAHPPPPKIEPIVDGQNPAPRQFVTRMDQRIKGAFPTGKPVEDEPEKVNCKHCRRPLLKSLAANHVRECLRVKQEKQQRKKLNKEKKAREAADNASQIDDAESIVVGDSKANKKDPRKTAAGKATAANDDKKMGKKRKAEGEAEKAAPSKKKKKDEPKVKAAKPKGPVDVEKQCGVQLPNGAQCARSLTCKSHSMGAKRAVLRSLPYDMLLAQYQKKNQARQQRAALVAIAPLYDESDQQGPVDSEEEKEAVMAAIARSRPQPLMTRPAVDNRMKFKYIRIKEALHNAMAGSRGAGLFSTGPSQLDTSRSGLLSAGPGSATGLHSAGIMPPDSAGIFGNGAFASPLGSAALESPGFSLDGPQRRASGAQSGPRQILPGQLPGPQRKQSVSGAV